MLKKLMAIALLSAVVCARAKAGAYAEMLLDWKIYINPEGKYSIVFSPTQSNPYNWDLQNNPEFNTFELRQGIFGYRTRLNDFTSIDIAALVDETEDSSIEFKLDRGFVNLKRPQNPYYEFKAGMLLTPNLEWDRKNLWPYEMFKFTELQFLDILPRSQAGAMAGAGFASEQGRAAVEVDYLYDPIKNAPNSDRFDARAVAGFSSAQFSLDGMFNYSTRGQPDRTGWQELYQGGIACRAGIIKIGGEYFKGRSWVPAGDAYILGNFPEGFADFLFANGRTFTEGKPIDFYGWSAVASLQPAAKVWLVYRYDFFDPSSKFDDDQEDLNIAGIVYQAADSLMLGAAFEMQDFAARSLPPPSSGAQMAPLESIIVSLRAALP